MTKQMTVSKRRWMVSTATVAVLATVGAVALFGPATTTNASTTNASTPGAPVAVESALPGSFADIAEQVSAAVVNIQVSRRITPRTPTADNLDPRLDEFLERFGERFGFDAPNRERFGRRNHDDRGGPGAPRRVAGVGSGFIIDPAGFIVTNDHVVGDSDEIRVTMKNGEQFDATLIGRDPKTDLALIKVEPAEDLPYVGFGDSDAARVGDWVIAVGNPFGLSHTVTVGVVSANDRAIGAGGPYDEFLQIDASINRGNSGGPAFNTAGEVIGVNSSIFSPNGGSVGIGFAIPANVAQKVIAELRATGTIERGWLGVSIQQVTPDIADSLGLDAPEGALVADVVADSPADRAKLAQGDVILAVDGEKVEELRDLPRLIADVRPGQSAALRVWRDGAARTVDARIGRSEDTVSVAAAIPSSADEVLGLRLRSLTSGARADYGVADGVEGVVITEIDDDSPARKKGLRPGDVILAVGNDAVASPADVVEKVRAATAGARGSVLFLISRDANQRFVAVPLRDA